MAGDIGVMLHVLLLFANENSCNTAICNSSHYLKITREIFTEKVLNIFTTYIVQIDLLCQHTFGCMVRWLGNRTFFANA